MTGPYRGVNPRDEQLVWRMVQGSLKAKTAQGDGGLTHFTLREITDAGKDWVVNTALAALVADMLEQLHDDPGEVIRRHLIELEREAAEREAEEGE